MNLVTLALTAAAYLVGSLPIGLWVGRLRGVDLRQHGSGNIGATNVGRVLGARFAVLVFLLDFCKGLGPVLAARQVQGGVLAPLLTGVAAVLGHVFPLYLGFRGGKGVATAGGAFAGLDPVAAAAALSLWVVVLLLSRMVSLASVLAAWSFPVVRLAVHGARWEDAVTWASLVVAVLITLRHRTNLARIRRGQEPRVGLPRLGGPS